MLENVYTDEQVRARLAGFILLPCSTYDHTEARTGQVLAVQGRDVRRAPGDRARDAPPLPGREPRRRAAAPRVRRERQASSTRQLYEMKTAGLIEFLDRGLTLFVEGGRPNRARRAARRAGPPRRRRRSAAAAPRRSCSPELEQRVAAIVKADDAGEGVAHEGAAHRRDARSGARRSSRSSGSSSSRRTRRSSSARSAIPSSPRPRRRSSRSSAEKDALARNCAVVTLEEMANPAACMPLRRAVQEGEGRRDPQGHRPGARSLRRRKARSPRDPPEGARSSSIENVRAGAAMSLGYFLAGRRRRREGVSARAGRRTGAT